MKCLACGNNAMKSGREDFAYTASGLSSVILRNVRVDRCSGCGEFEVEIRRVEQLHRMLAAGLVRKSGRLAPEEIRFFRKHLGLSGRELGRLMGTTVETISRWETGSLAMGGPSDRLLRLMVVQRVADRNFALESLSGVSKSRARPQCFTVERTAKGEWSPAKAA